ncbi:hypothetical protein F2Q69_00042338 [Brassica cretica]|uniref:Uncharacterized protein n=1 Tax=Brassica cretica TaxID=69181 RepID=A0A8S9NU97_BRACR|nr:hypothetical protein F2Q69_00042338 [Brassica cretica]
MSNFNQNSQYHKPYNNSYSNNKNYGSSYYQKPPPPTQESKIEEMIDRVHAQQYQKQQGNSTAILTRSCKFGTFDPQGSALLIE